MVGDILKDAEKITLKNIGDILIEADMAVRYDGGKKTHKWCDPINE